MDVPQDPVLIFAQRFQAFFESTTDAIAVFNPEGEILDANPQMVRLSGYAYDRIVTKKLEDLFETESFQEIWLRFQILLEGRIKRYPIECMLKPLKGRLRHLEMNLSLLKNQYGYPQAVLAVMRDVSKRKEAEANLIQKAEELEKVFDAVPTILMLVDTRRRIRRINRSRLDVIGLKDKDVIGQRIGEILGCEYHFQTQKGCGFGAPCRKCLIKESVLRCLKLGETILNVEGSIPRKGLENQLFYFRINIVPLETRGQRWGVVSLEDITDRRQAERESLQLHNRIAKTNIELNKTLEDLAKSQSQLVESQKLEQIGLLASGLAHNLKTPLSGIKGYAQLLKIDHPQYTDLNLIVEEVVIMEGIINNLMLKSRKGHERKEELLNLNDLIEIEMKFLMANMFFKHRVQHTFKLDPQLPMISGVYAHFSQAIMNVVQNALDAMYQTSKRKFTIQTRHDNQNVIIEISDTGCGIPKDIQDKIFEVFFTTKPTSTEREGDEPFGTGLGLSSATYFIQQYGGTIFIKKSDENGTVIVIQIPHQRKEDKQSVYRVLVVDDSDNMVEVITHICHEMGIEAVGASSSARGIELYRKLKPDVVVSDISMKDYSGQEMLREVRRLNSDQRIVYISNYSDNSEITDWLDEESRRPALSAVMRKPFPLDNFRKVLQRMVFD